MDLASRNAITVERPYIKEVAHALTSTCSGILDTMRSVCFIVLAVAVTTPVSNSCDVCTSGCSNTITLEANKHKVYGLSCPNKQVQLSSIRVDGFIHEFTVTVLDEVEYTNFTSGGSPSYNRDLSTGGVDDEGAETTCFKKRHVITFYQGTTVYVIVKCTNEFFDCNLEVGIDYSCVTDDPCSKIDCGVHAVCHSGTCQISNECSGIHCGPHGICNKGVCECNPGYNGDRCQNVDNQQTCSGISCGSNGYCNEGVCECNPGYNGGRCQNVDNEQTCFGLSCGSNGVCNEGVCDCDPGYSGDRCDIVSDCNGISCGSHGACDIHNKVCICHSGYTYTKDGCQYIDPNCDENSSCKKSNTNIIAGGVAGGVVLLLCLIILVVFVKHRRNQRGQQQSQPPVLFMDHTTQSISSGPLYAEIETGEPAIPDFNKDKFPTNSKPSSCAQAMSED